MQSNILLQPQSDVPQLKAWGFDFGDALVGWPSDFAMLSAGTVPATGNLARGIPVPLVISGQGHLPGYCRSSQLLCKKSL